VILADFGVVFVIVVGAAVFLALFARDAYLRKNPPPTVGEVTDKLEKELAEINKKIEEGKDQWDT
jgi:hypothetical protein